MFSSWFWFFMSRYIVYIKIYKKSMALISKSCSDCTGVGPDGDRLNHLMTLHQLTHYKSGYFLLDQI